MPRTDLLHVLLRRWYVVLSLLVVTLALAFGASVLVPAKYSASANVLLLPPPAPNAENPYIALDGLQAFAASFAPSVLNDAAIAKLASEGITGGYNIVADTTTPAPILLVTTSGKSGAGALDAMTKVEALIPPALLQFQKGVAEKDRVSSQTTFADTTAKTVRKSQTRAVLVAVVFGLVLTGLAAVGVDRLLLRRRRRGAQGDDDSDGPGSAPADVEWTSPRSRPSARPTAPLPSRRPTPPRRQPKRKTAGGETQSSPPFGSRTNGVESHALINGSDPISRPESESSGLFRNRAMHRSRRPPRPSTTVQNSHD